MNSEERDKQQRRELILELLQNQMTSAETPEVRVHYKRLRSLGYSNAQARELIATVLVFYLWHTARKDDYTYSDYVAELARLPDIDWKRSGHDDA